MRDISERRAFEEKLLSIAEEEQRRIGQDLHDDIGQELTGLALKAENLAEIISEGHMPKQGAGDEHRHRAGLDSQQAASAGPGYGTRGDRLQGPGPGPPGADFPALRGEQGDLHLRVPGAALRGG